MQGRGCREFIQRKGLKKGKAVNEKRGIVNIIRRN
jgi:hypothetical protein